jgi:TatD DNase family protein
LIDSHVHLSRSEFDADRDATMARAAAAGVEKFLEIGYDLVSSRAAVALAESDPRVWAAVGVHPHDASLLADPEGRFTEAGAELLGQLGELCRHPRVVAIGEIGLDFYRDLSPRPAQRTALELQLGLAADTALPVVFHTRDAYPELRALVDRVGVPFGGGVLHSFAGDAAAVAWARARALKMGIGGPLTYKNSPLPGLLAEATLDDLLLETDAPWLPPVPHRGERNEPAFLAYTCRRLSEVYGVTPAEVARRTGSNFESLFLATGSA